tara:strand:- start:1211 stop:2767 length:1557 start_codon:yes stop_codon:yes gene_type:complete
MTWANKRREIAAHFCRTVLVLDDEILEHSDGSSTLDHAAQFLKAKEKFAEKGILCDLRHVGKTVEASCDAMRNSLRHADVVVVDWYLGVGSGEDPKESISVLNEMLRIGGERFVAIHSQEEPETIREYLGKAFRVKAPNRKYQGEAEDAGVVPIIESGKDETDLPENDEASPEILTLRNLSSEADEGERGSKIHVCILHKRTPSETADQLPNAILRALENAFPDHLHWVGLEFAARVRDMLPALVRGLPSDMDVALIFQSLVQRRDELAKDLVECLCLELLEIFRFEPLSSASDEVLNGRFLEMANLQDPSTFKGNPGKWLSELLGSAPQTTPKDWAVNRKILGKGVREKFSGELERLFGVTTGSSDKAHYRYAALREHLHSVQPSRIELYPGVVMIDTSLSAKMKWRLCLTPACDCGGSAEHEHLFVFGIERGSETETNGRGVWTSIYSGTHEVEVKWMMSSFHTQKCTSTGPTNWSPVTILRDPFVQKIVQSLWGQQSRIGVNTSEVRRVVRNDKE